MADWQDRLGGSHGPNSAGTVVASAVTVVNATSVQAVGTALNRVSFKARGDREFFVAFGADVATSTLSYSVPSGVEWEERDWLGPINVAVPSGASGLLRVRDVRF